MSSHPFQSSPTLGEYCDWLKREGGTVEPGENEWGAFLRLSYPKGRRDRRAIESVVDPDERLTPSKVTQLDRRLGVKSSWNPEFEAVDEPPPEEASESDPGEE